MALYLSMGLKKEHFSNSIVYFIKSIRLNYVYTHTHIHAVYIKNKP